MMQSEPFFYKREFLNLPGWHEGAFILASLAETGDNDKPLLYRLEMANCDQVIKFSIDVTNGWGRANTLHKLDTLEDAIGGFRRALAAWFDAHPVVDAAPAE